MGLLNFLKSQAIDVIEWRSTTTDYIVYPFPVQGNEIKMGAQLIVREGQVALFLKDGAIADVFEPGRHTLSTQNMPVMTKLQSWRYGFNSPFKADVYFVSTALFPNLKWGTSNPVIMRDQEFGMIRLRAHGIYAIKVLDPEKVLRESMGSSFYIMTTENPILDHFRKTILSTFTDLVASSKIPLLDMAGNYAKISKLLLEQSSEDFKKHGFELAKLSVENISLPQEVEKSIDKKTSMGVFETKTLAEFEMAKGLGNSGSNLVGSIAEMGAGLAIGQSLGKQMQASLLSSDSFNAGANNVASQTQASDGEDRFLTLARTTLRNTNGELTKPIINMLESSRKRYGISTVQAESIIEKVKKELNISHESAQEYKEMLAVFLANGDLSEDEKAILLERQAELGLTDEQVAKVRAEVESEL